MTNLWDKRKKTVATVVAALFIFSVVGFGLATLFGNDSPARVLATVNNREITRQDVDVWIGLFSVIYGPEIDDEETRQGILAQMIDERVLLQAADEKDVTADAGEVEEAADELWQALAMQAGGDSELSSALGAYGVERSDVHDLVHRALVIETLYEHLVAGIEKTTSEEALEYYRNHPDDFVEAARIRARHILVETEEEANDLLEQLEDGADFATLAHEHSLDEHSAVEGGDLGFFGPGAMVPEFEEVAFALEVGQTSEVVSTFFGYHIIKLEERTEARPFDFAEVEENIKASLDQKKGDDLFEQFLADLLDQATIR